MTARKVIALTLLAVLAVSSPLKAADDSLAENAALAYYQAYLFLPNLDDAKKSAVKEAAAGEKEISKDLVAILDESEIALHQLHRGAKLSPCVWGTEFEAGPNAMLAHLSEARELAKLACLRARYRFEQGNASAAVDDVVATLTLARHCSSAGVLVAVLVDYAIEAMVIEMAEGRVVPAGSDGHMTGLGEELTRMLCSAHRASRQARAIGALVGGVNGEELLAAALTR